MTATKKSDDAGQAEVQAKADEITDKGYSGVLPEGRPDNKEWSLETGPKSPTAAELRKAVKK